MRRIDPLVLVLPILAATLAPVAHAAPVHPPSAPPAPPTPGTYAAFRERLIARVDAIPLEPLRAEYQVLARKHGIDPASDTLLRDYVRVRTVFEATRDGGYFGVRWAITNQEPSSRLIWSAWQKTPPASLAAPSCSAECDEISAMTALFGRALGVRRLGLYWPTWNHTIVAWEPPGTKARVLVPTTQIFQGCAAGIGSTSFSATAQRTVFEYGARDVQDAQAVPAADFLLAELDVYADASSAMLALLRLHRGARYGSSFSDCRQEQAALVDRLRAAPLSKADHRALAHYANVELRAGVADAGLLAWMGTLAGGAAGGER
jgi:hypothetical protein